MTKMFNPLWRWIRNRLQNCDDYNTTSSRLIGLEVQTQPNPRHSHNAASRVTEHGLCFVVYQATGGWVIETLHYSEKRDETSTKLHIVDADSDLGTEIGKILTIEYMRI